MKLVWILLLTIGSSFVSCQISIISDNQCNASLCILIRGIIYITRDDCITCVRMNTCTYAIENCDREQQGQPALQKYDTCPNPQYNTCVDDF